MISCQAVKFNISNRGNGSRKGEVRFTKELKASTVFI